MRKAGGSNICSNPILLRLLLVVLLLMVPSGQALLRRKPVQPITASSSSGAALGEVRSQERPSRSTDDSRSSNSVVPPVTRAARSLFIAAVTGGAVAASRDPRARSWLEDLTPISARYLPLAKHQLLILAAWALNQAAVRVPGRLDGKSWKSSTLVRFFTPSGWAFAIWAPIFLGEMIFAFYQLTSRYTSPQFQPFLARLAPPLASAFFTQSLWCLAFRPWASGMQYISASLLGLTAIGLAAVHKVLRQAANEGAMCPLDYLIVHLPLSLHFGWITCATLVNLNGWFASTSLRTGDKLGLALGSVNLAVTLGSKVTLTSGDPIYSLVVAWALYAIADDLKPSKSYLRQAKAVGDDALDCLETTALVSANIQVGVAAILTLWKVALFFKLVRPGDWMFWAKKAEGSLSSLID